MFDTRGEQDIQKAEEKKKTLTWPIHRLARPKVGKEIMASTTFVSLRVRLQPHMQNIIRYGQFNFIALMYT